MLLLPLVLALARAQAVVGRTGGMDEKPFGCVLDRLMLVKFCPSRSRVLPTLLSSLFPLLVPVLALLLLPCAQQFQVSCPGAQHSLCLRSQTRSELLVQLRLLDEFGVLGCDCASAFFCYSARSGFGGRRFRGLLEETLSHLEKTLSNRSIEVFSRSMVVKEKSSEKVQRPR